MASILAALLKNESGGRNIANTTQGTSSGQAQGYFQITTGTWKDFGGTKYAANPLGATYEQQADIASQIPLKRWDSSTLAAMRATGNPIDPSKTLGQNLAMNGETFGTSPDGGIAGITEATASPDTTMGATNANSTLGIMSDGSLSNNTTALTMQSPWADLQFADANGDGTVTQTELTAYNAQVAGAGTPNLSSPSAEGNPSDVPTAIVTAGNQQAVTQANAIKALAASQQAASQSENATNTSIWSSFQTWLGGRLLQVMVFVLALIFVLVGLYMFAPKGALPSVSVS